MQFTIIATALLATFASAADICKTTSSSCGGTRSCCTGIQENICCNLNAAVSTGIFYTLPANSRGQAWSAASCTGSSTTFQNPNARSVCLTGFTARSARWLTGLSSRVKRDEGDLAARCAEPDTVYYERDGVEKRAAIPEGKRDEILSAVDADDVEMLDALTLDSRDAGPPGGPPGW